MRSHIVSRTQHKKWWQSPLIAVFLMVIILWGTIVVIKTSLKFRDADAMREQSELELNDLAEKEAAITKKIRNLSTDRGLETEVRNRFRVARPGEELVIIVPKEEATVTAISENNDESFWKKVRLFVGL